MGLFNIKLFLELEKIGISTDHVKAIEYYCLTPDRHRMVIPCELGSWAELILAAFS